MLNGLIGEFKKFSKNNWWIYVLLLVALGVVIYTGKGNIYEITALFLLNLLAALFNMLMMSSFKDSKFKQGATFILISNVIYTFVSCYSFFVDGNAQYLIWQGSFLLTGVQTFLYYNYDINLKFINFWTLFVLNSIILFVILFYGNFIFSIIIQSFGLAIVTLGIIIKNDTKRYFTILVGNIGVATGSILLMGVNYYDGKLLGVTIGYGLLSLSICSYNLKILPVYISRVLKS